jgi:predicted metal-dependent hydrolase
MIVGGVRVEVVRKDIKNLHLGVYPPNGRVRVAAPLVLDDEAIRLAVIEKLAWIKRHKAKFENQPRQSKREMVNGESHYFLGQRYRLRVHEQAGTPKIALRGIATMGLFVRPGASQKQREAILLGWYRKQLKMLLPPLLERWQAVTGVETASWGIKRMRTKWGSCSIKARRIWLNLELAKRPTQCLEYVLVHELVHLLERHHNERFLTLMDQFMPQWRQFRDMLNEIPLGHEEWNY